MPAQPKHIRAFELRLEANWSSEDVVNMLTPDFVEMVLLRGFAALEATIKMRALIAFLGARAERLASLRVHLRALLRIADDDKDEWVQVVSGLVRRKLLPSEPDGLGDSGGTAAAAPQDPAVYSSAVLSKTVTEVLERAQRIMSERRGNDDLAASGGGGGGGIRHVLEAPYFGPLEERYVSRKQQPPRKEFANAHFRAKYDFLNEFTEDLASHVTSASNNASSSASGPGSAATAAQGARASQGGSSKPPGGSSAPQSAPAGPNLAQARRVSLAATDPAVGSDGLRRTSKPLALSRNHAGLQPGAAGAQFGSRKGSAGAGGARGMRGGSGSGVGGKAGLMMINVDELQAIHADKQTAREKAKGRPGRKKAKVETPDERRAAGDGGQPPPPSVAVDGGGSGNGRPQDGASTNGKGKAAESEEPAKPLAPPRAPMPVPQQGEIEAMAAMLVLGDVGGGGDADAKTSYLPESLATLLENANSLRPEGKEKLESFFQKRTPEGSPQERVKYHEEVSEGADGELVRVTSYIRLDYETWVWDRVHKKKRVRS